MAIVIIYIVMIIGVSCALNILSPKILESIGFVDSSNAKVEWRLFVSATWPILIIWALFTLLINFGVKYYDKD